MTTAGTGPGWRTVRADRSLRRLGQGAWVGGSPLLLFRVTEAGDELLGQLLAADPYLGMTVNGRAARSLVDRLVLAGAAHPLPVPHPGVTDAIGASDVTVVVPVRDRPDSLRRLLESLAADAMPPAHVVVVDDGSTDPAEVRAVAGRYGAEVIRNATATGPAAARNNGLEAVATELVAFVDSDVRVHEHWIEPLLAHLADERVGVVAPRVRSVEANNHLSRYEQLHSPLDMGPEPALVRPGSRVSYVPAAALVARTGVVVRLGGFEETMRYGEDVDLIWRAVADGGLVRYEPASSVEHVPRTELRDWIGQRMAYGSSAVALESRHRGSVAPVVCSGWSAATWGLAAAGHPLLGVALGGATAAALARKLHAVPAPEAISLALSGHLGTGRQLSRAMVRPWWPAALAAALLSRRARRVLAVSLMAELAARSGGPAERLTSLLDDAAYGAGVWSAAVRARRWRALAPAFTSWP